MPQLIKPMVTKILTKDGECQINISLELTININSDGTSTSNISAVKAAEITQENDKPNWVIPDFAPIKNKIDFGKND